MCLRKETSQQPGLMSDVTLQHEQASLYGSLNETFSATDKRIHVAIHHVSDDQLLTNLTHAQRARKSKSNEREIPTFTIRDTRLIAQQQVWKCDFQFCPTWNPKSRNRTVISFTRLERVRVSRTVRTYIHARAECERTMGIGRRDASIHEIKLCILKFRLFKYCTDGV